jgi:hypothetical protein
MIVAEFTETYCATVALIEARLAALDADKREFESPDVVAAGFTGLPRQLILSLQPDEHFVKTVYNKVLDRDVEPDELEILLARLEARPTDRDAFIDELTASEDALDRKVRIQWV